MITRRGFLKGFGALVLSGVSFAGYAVGIEPLRLRTQRYRLTPPGWTDGLKLKIAVIADVHACAPWMTADRIRAIADATNAEKPDLTVLLGDYITGHRWITDRVDSPDWSHALAGLRAPLGVHAILGNHDWWDDRAAQKLRRGPIIGRTALENVGIPVYENDVVRLEKDGRPFWLAGLGDQLALRSKRIRGRRRRFTGVDDLPGTLAKITDDAPVILLAHEPDIFPKVPARVSLTLSGHTHGGQVRILGYSPVVPSRYGNRYAYGHIVESEHGTVGPQTRLRGGGEKHLIVSGGLGCSIMPVRLGMPPEIVVAELGH